MVTVTITSVLYSDTCLSIDGLMYKFGNLKLAFIEWWFYIMVAVKTGSTLYVLLNDGFCCRYTIR